MTKLAAFIAASLLSTVALAQGYPNRPVRVIVPWPPGQATDIAARVVAEKLQQALKQPFIIDNRAGAGGSIGTDAAVKSAPDGYTLLAASSGPISIMPHLQKTPYDANRDFAPISLVALVPFAHDRGRGRSDRRPGRAYGCWNRLGRASGRTARAASNRLATGR